MYFWIHNSSELLAMLCVAGVVACAFRWRTATRRDFLFAFALFLAGTFMRELALWMWGLSSWPPEALLWSGMGRVAQIAGGLLFIRAALRDYCGEWGWIAVFALAAMAAGVL